MPERHEITKKAVVYTRTDSDRVTIRRGVEYRATDAGALTIDLYYPPDFTPGARLPAVVFVMGFSDVGARMMLGCATNEMESYISWAKLIAASGMVAVTYTTGKDPASDVQALLDYVRLHGASFGIDEHRLGVWACSGHGPNALALLMQEGGELVKCAVLYYPLTLDLDGSTGVAEAARIFRFANSAAGKSADDLPQNLPLFITRAGHDETPHLNDALDRFVPKLVSRNLPLTFVNHAAAPHAFDLMHDSEATRDIIRQTLAFMQFHLLGAESRKDAR